MDSFTTLELVNELINRFNSLNGINMVEGEKLNTLGAMCEIEVVTRMSESYTYPELEVDL